MKPIDGFPGYCIERDGTIWSYKTRSSNGHLARNPRKLHPCADAKGYLVVCITKSKKSVRKYVHRLIAEAFIPNPRNLPHVLHNDDVKTHNSLGNIRWGNNSDNMKDAYLNRQVKRGIPANKTKLTKIQVLEIRERYSRGNIGGPTLAKEHNVNSGTIYNIIHRRTWKWL